MLKATSSMTKLMQILEELRTIYAERKKLSEATSQFRSQEEILMRKSVELESQIRQIVYDETHE